MTKKLLVLLLLALALVAYLALRILDRGGVWLDIAPHFEGHCTPVTGVVGAEDITIDQQTGFAYISSDDRRRRNGGEEVQGSIMGLDLRDPQSRPIPLTRVEGRPFHPHGISLLETPAGEKRLFVINHPSPASHQVELFRIANRQLKHLETIVDEALTSPNDIVAVGPRSFYVTNDHGSSSGLMRTLEEFLALPLAGIAYFDGDSGREVATGLSYPNGIAVPANGKTLYVAETTGRSLTAFHIDSSGALAYETSLGVKTGADNLEWSAGGDLLLAGHPKTLDFLAHAASAEALSPSQVLKINVTGDKPEIIELYLDDGSQISGSSVAARYGDTLLIGSVFEEQILRCTMN